MKDQLIIDQQT